MLRDFSARYRVYHGGALRSDNRLTTLPLAHQPRCYANTLSELMLRQPIDLSVIPDFHGQKHSTATFVGQ